MVDVFPLLSKGLVDSFLVSKAPLLNKGLVSIAVRVKMDRNLFVKMDLDQLVRDKEDHQMEEHQMEDHQMENHPILAG